MLHIENGSKTATLQIRIDHAGTFELPQIHETNNAKLPALMFHAAAHHLAEAADAIASIDSDATLSELGKARKLDPVRRQLVEKVANADASVDVDARYWDAQEAELLAVPKIDPGHTVAAIEDRELRDWWRSQSVEERTKLMQRMLAEPGNARLMIAMLRSPIPQLDHEVKFMRDLWNQLARLNDPAKSFAIEDGRANVEWARRGIANVAGLARRVVKMEERAIAETLLGATNETIRKKHALFGVSFQTMETTKRVAEQRARAKA